MDIIPIAGMIFSLLMVVTIGGFILLIPISRRLGKFLEIRIDERMEWDTLPKEALQDLVGVVEQLQDSVKKLEDRQQFVERLLEPGKRDASGHGGGTGSSGAEG